MVRLEENAAEIRRMQKELDKTRTNSPHYRDTAKRLRKLRNERAEALRNLKSAGRI